MTHRYIIAVILSAMPAIAGSFSFTAVTTGQPVFNRPLLNVGSDTTSFTSLSPNGTAVSYVAKAINIVGAGTYTFTSAANFDNALFLYSSFNPLNPLNNVIIAQTAYLQPTQGTSTFNVALASGSYVIVTTGVFNTDSGTANNTVNGPGTITAASATPEPGPIVLIGVGLVAIGAKRFKRKTT